MTIPLVRGVSGTDDCRCSAAITDVDGVEAMAIKFNFVQLHIDRRSCRVPHVAIHLLTDSSEKHSASSV